MNTFDLINIAFLPLERRRDFSKRTAVSSAIEPQQPMCRYPDLVEGSSPCADTGTAGVSDSSENKMGDNGFASFSRDVQAIEANMLNTGKLLREATHELNARQRLIEHYRRKAADHERLIGKLLKLINEDDLDGARDLVKDEYDAIHGPAD